MPAYRFSWEPFSNSCIEGLARSLGHQQTADSPENPRELLSRRYKRPTEDFVRETKDALSSYWLPEYPGAGSLVERLMSAGIGPGGRPRSQSGYVEYIRNTRNCASLRRALQEALLRFGDMDRTPTDEDEDILGVKRFAVLVPKQMELDPRRPYSYQTEAWNRLSAHLAEAQTTGSFRGLLVMPTGSGKTFTSMRWLMEKVVNRGGRVLWIAHRHELLEQAAHEAHVLAAHGSNRERLRVRIVSGMHCGVSQIDPADDIIVASVATLARRMDAIEQLLIDERTFVVIDEAHHAPAKSYRDILERILAGKHHRVLGITATPTRTAETERPVLARLFGQRVLYEVAIQSLIERKFLARPIPVRVDTKVDPEKEVTARDVEHLAQFNELSEEWLDRIARLTQRNQLILDHFCERREKYGPTLIFAINVAHAALLTESLRERGIQAEYVASYRPDGTALDNIEIVERFRRGQLDVLVNVQILTEGVDLPSVKTVLLTRPTCSEILLRQMIGRALRGPAAGGTEVAYLVSFEDHWERFQNYGPTPFKTPIPATGALGFWKWNKAG